MAKAKAEITLSRIVDIASVTRYYKLQASTAAAPAKPTANPPSGWTTTEPGYTSGSTQTLYCVDLTGFTNGTWSYSEVSKSSSYEAAKAAYNKAVAAEGTAKDAKDTIDNMEIGGRNLILNSKGNTKAGFFKYFHTVTDEYAEITLKSKKQYSNISIGPGFLLGVRDYIVGEKYTWSYDIMYTAWNFPTGANRRELWMGQRYTSAPSGQTATGQWVAVTAHNLPVVGSNGCELNKWYHVEKVVTIPNQASDNVGSAASIQFYNSCADVEAGFTARIKNVKLEKGNVATDWTPAPEDTETQISAIKGRLELCVQKDDNDQIVSMINASANQIALKSNRLTIDSDNFTLAADGTVTATGANLKGNLFLDNGVRIKQAPTAEGESDEEYCTAWEATDGWAHTSFLTTPMTTHFKEDVLIDGELYYKDSADPVADVVIEQGTSGIWTYRKWASGTAECWGYKKYGDLACNIAFGSMYETKEVDTELAYPTGLFKDLTYHNICSSSTSQVFFVEHISTWGSNGKVGQIWLIRPTSATLLAPALSFHAIGRWK